MLVSHRKKFIFTKTSKTAGTSVEVYFEKYCVPEGDWEFAHGRDEHISDTGIIGHRGTKKEKFTFYDHMTASEIKEEVGNEIWDNYFKFTVIRNPFDKMVSAFYHFEKINNEDKYIDDGKNDIERFREWIKKGGAFTDKSIYSINGEIAVDFFIRFEYLNEDIDHVCKIIGIPYEGKKIPKLKTGYRDKSTPLQKMYDKETESIIRDLYKFEIDHFKYKLN